MKAPYTILRLAECQHCQERHKAPCGVGPYSSSAGGFMQCLYLARISAPDSPTMFTPIRAQLCAYASANPRQRLPIYY